MIQIILYWIAVSFALLVTTFSLYLAVIKLRDMKEADTIKDLHWLAKGIGYFLLYFGLVCDTFLNWICLTVLMWEWPQEYLCTARVRRLKVSGSPRRKEQALWWCRGWLTPVDKSHCE